MVTREQIENSLDATLYRQQDIRISRLSLPIVAGILPVAILIVGLITQDFIFALLFIGAMGGLALTSLLLFFLYSVRRYRRLFTNLYEYEVHTVVLDRPCTPFGHYKVISYLVEFRLMNGRHVRQETRKIFSTVVEKNIPQASDYTGKTVQIAYKPSKKLLIVLGFAPEDATEQSLKG
ncbi:MAG: hypothetical protein IJY12_00835 [Clostridia bacterium]|nr:hypothetical protein [Clostridia bacterium]